jgi:glycosyltransferase involved in cell wall biosynthesis
VDPADTTALADAIAALLADPDGARAMGERGRAAVLRGYSWGTQAPRLLAFYERLLNR